MAKKPRRHAEWADFSYPPLLQPPEAEALHASEERKDSEAPGGSWVRRAWTWVVEWMASLYGKCKKD